MISLAVTEELREQAQKDGIEAGEDYNRTKKERDFDRYVGDLGELAFKQILEQNTNFEYKHLGGKKDADFVVEGFEVDVKTRTVIGENKKDLIVPADLPDGFHDFYVLLRCVYAEDDDLEDLDRHERTIEALEFIGLWNKRTIEEKGESFNPPWVQGRSSDNNRYTVICDYGTHADLMDFAPLMQAQQQAQPAD
ncbi:hypothetical protein [Haloferax sp. Atlit-12N]|uniref:hypothetical protein n=1 Tax=Haloferax sp. Atlit-12N TaxID=2077203 RepID=UPI0011E5B88C|nr:hypothetical protein [Haloferax sp. Atlit-12N]